MGRAVPPSRNRVSTCPKLPPESDVVISRRSSPRRVVRLIAAPSVFRPKSTEGPRITSSRSTASRGIRSKFTSSTVGSLIRTPSRKTLTPCGSPVTGDTTNPRMETVGWRGLPCSSWRHARQTPDRVREHPLLRRTDLLPFEEVGGPWYPGPWQPLGLGRGSGDANGWQLDQTRLGGRTIGALGEARAGEEREDDERGAGEPTRSPRAKGNHARRRYPIRCSPASARGMARLPRGRELASHGQG